MTQVERKDTDRRISWEQQLTEFAFGLAPEVRTTDVDEAADALGRVYVAAELTPIDTKSVNMQMNALQLPLLTAGYLGFGVDVAIRADDVTAYYIDAPLSGRAVSRWRDGGLAETTTGSVAIFTPGTPCVLDWSDDCGHCFQTPPNWCRILGSVFNGAISSPWLTAPPVLIRRHRAAASTPSSSMSTTRRDTSCTRATARSTRLRDWESSSGTCIPVESSRYGPMIRPTLISRRSLPRSSTGPRHPWSGSPTR